MTFRFFPGVNTAYQADHATPLPVDSTMLVYVSPDATISFHGNNWSDGTDGGDYGSGDDAVLTSTGTYTAGTYRQFPSYNTTDNYAGSNVYVVVYDYPYASYVANGNSIPDGTDYDILSTTYALPAPGVPAVFAPTEVLYTDSNITIVPEPTTLALFATGVGVLMMRRRKKQAGETEQSA